MPGLNGERITWIDNLNKRLHAMPAGSGEDHEDKLEQLEGRVRLVARARWLLLLLIGIYSIYAGGFFSFSRYGFFLSGAQLLFIFLSVAAVITYNYLYHFHFAAFSHKRGALHWQLILDIIFVLILIHFSGGAASWFWPVYLIITIESSFLLERKGDVWLVGAFGAIFYGLLLVVEFNGIIAPVKMPFVDMELHKDGLYLLLIWFWLIILNAIAAIIGTFLMSVIRNETRLLRQSEERLITFLDSANDLIHSNTPDGRFLYVNRAWQHIMGYSLEELTDHTIFDLIHEHSRVTFLAELNRIIDGEKINSIEVSLVARNGSLITIEGNMTCSFKDGEPVAIWGICRDITERKQVQEQLYQLAHHDTLTGLPNRVLFIDRMKIGRALAHRQKLNMGVLYLDLDRFKIINDSLGHNVGDGLLTAVADRLTACVREIDTVSRIGGDEFVIILVNVSDTEAVEKVARKILMAFAEPFQIDGHELFITTSIGISIYPKDSDDIDGLVKKADSAMYYAKGQGRNNFQFYHPTLDENAQNRLVLENRLRRALEREELRIFYQPKIDMLSGRISSVEALLRWQHPELGLLSPADFIPLAEETGLIVTIGEWVLMKACEQNKQWQEKGFPPMRVAVNLSANQLQQKNLLDVIKNVLDATGMDASYLELEITETVVMQQPEFVTHVLTQLQDIGIHISIDDFGTGYSSLAHLKRFSINTLKIDKTFVRDVEVNSTDAAIAMAIIAMGNSLNLRVTAEGVETAGQFAFLKENLCDEMQGYFFSRPLPPEEMEECIRNNKGQFFESEGEGNR
jgi:diguanylate cyclase (GGDEF)-like protein/PAS domain S-box-containing protein